MLSRCTVGVGGTRFRYGDMLIQLGIAVALFAMPGAVFARSAPTTVAGSVATIHYFPITSHGAQVPSMYRNNVIWAAQTMVNGLPQGDVQVRSADVQDFHPHTLARIPTGTTPQTFPQSRSSGTWTVWLGETQSGKTAVPALWAVNRTTGRLIQVFQGTAATPAEVAGFALFQNHLLFDARTQTPTGANGVDNFRYVSLPNVQGRTILSRPAACTPQSMAGFRNVWLVDFVSGCGKTETSNVYRLDLTGKLSQLSHSNHAINAVTNGVWAAWTTEVKPVRDNTITLLNLASDSRRQIGQPVAGEPARCQSGLLDRCVGDLGMTQNLVYWQTGARGERPVAYDIASGRQFAIPNWHKNDFLPTNLGFGWTHRYSFIADTGKTARGGPQRLGLASK